MLGSSFKGFDEWEMFAGQLVDRVADLAWKQHPHHEDLLESEFQGRVLYRKKSQPGTIWVAHVIETRNGGSPWVKSGCLSRVEVPCV